ncbi:uncharacterized protein LOC107022213 [Solanum pennellii]|uniref:Uncharacterized protein LOC107022213 n=1 Tax=Solanum pennellii TaxID=28526 RepID=A0ABM1GZY2_SOLPN|nr:uncharacterized protein LOC107022213 [Solanum pennellii]
MIHNHRGWHEMLPYALLNYRTTVRTSIGATPYLLVYGTETVITSKVEIPSLRIIQEIELSNTEWVSKQIDQLTLIDEKRMVAICHGQLYRQRMIWDFNKRVRDRILEVGQLVLKRIFPNQDKYKGKFAPNWQGPYMVRKVLSVGALVLSEMDGTAWPKPINSDAVKRYNSGKIGKTVNWDRIVEDGLKISAWVHLQVCSDSGNSPANNQINLQASDSKKFVKPDMT